MAANMFFHVLFVMTLIRSWSPIDCTKTVISVKNDIGDIYDCVDIYKQPAFKHPTIRDSAIQLLDLERHEHGKSSDSRLAHSVKCPSATVPIPRDRVRRQKEPLLTYPSQNQSYLDDEDDGPELKFAGLRVSGKTFQGAQASISLYNPKVYKDDQFTSAMISIEQGPDQIKAGWMVNPGLYGDRRTRFFTWWTATDDEGHTTGCYNVKCPGFVITNDIFPLDYAFPNMSQPYQKSVEMRVDVTMDPNTGNWKLQLDRVNIGFWPGSIFTSLGRLKANVMRFGGEAWTREDEISPQMGSGVFKNGRYQLTCYFAKMFFNDDRNFPTDPRLYGTVEPVETDCYYEGDHSYKDHDDLGYCFLFGGRGGASIKSC